MGSLVVKCAHPPGETPSATCSGRGVGIDLSISRATAGAKSVNAAPALIAPILELTGQRRWRADQSSLAALSGWRSARPRPADSAASRIARWMLEGRPALPSSVEPPRKPWAGVLAWIAPRPGLELGIASAWNWRSFVAIRSASWATSRRVDPGRWAQLIWRPTRHDDPRAAQWRSRSISEDIAITPVRESVRCARGNSSCSSCTTPIKPR